MTGRIFVTLFTIAVVLPCGATQNQDEPRLLATKQRLTAKEAQAVRQAIFASGPTTASRSLKRPYPRILFVPKDIEAVYAKKPQATTRLLLKIVEGGRGWDSIHAAGCIHALVWAPEFGAILVRGQNVKTWDDPIAKGRETRREFTRLGCIRLIIKKEKGKTEK